MDNIRGMGQVGRGRTEGDPTAVVVRRIIATVVDGFIVAAVLVVLLLTSMDSEPVPAGVEAGEACRLLYGSTSGCMVVDGEAWRFNAGLFSPTVLVPMLLSIGNQVVLTGLTGFSVGKAVTGLRVVRRADGGLPGIKGALGRTLPLLVFFPPLSWIIPIVEFGMVLTTKGHRRMGDMIGRTLVVDRGDAGWPPEVPGLPNPTPDHERIDPPGPGPDHERIDPPNPIDG